MCLVISEAIVRPSLVCSLGQHLRHGAEDPVSYYLADASVYIEMTGRAIWR